MKPISRFAAIFIVTFALLAAGCPQKTGIEKAAASADALPRLTDSVITAVGQAYDAKVLTLAQKDAFAASCQKVIDGGRAFDNALKAAKAAGDTSASTIATLNALFSTQVVAPFLQILNDLKVIDPTKGAAILAAIAVVRTAILTISGAFTQAGYKTGAEVLYAHNV